MSGNGFVKVDWGFGLFESHLALLVRGWRGLLAVRSCSFFMQQATTGCAPRLKKGTPGRNAGRVAFPDRRSGRLVSWPCAGGHWGRVSSRSGGGRWPEVPARHGLGRSGARAHHISQVGPDATDGEERTDETGRGGPVCGETDSGSPAA